MNFNYKSLIFLGAFSFFFSTEAASSFSDLEEGGASQIGSKVFKDMNMVPGKEESNKRAKIKKQRKKSESSLEEGKPFIVALKDLENLSNQQVGKLFLKKGNEQSPICFGNSILDKGGAQVTFREKEEDPLKGYALVEESWANSSSRTVLVLVPSEKGNNLPEFIFLGGVLFKQKKDSLYEVEYGKAKSNKEPWTPFVKGVLTYVEEAYKIVDYYAEVTPEDNFPSYRLACALLIPIAREGGDGLRFVSESLYTKVEEGLKLEEDLLNRLKEASHKQHPDRREFQNLIAEAKNKSRDLVDRTKKNDL